MPGHRVTPGVRGWVLRGAVALPTAGLLAACGGGSGASTPATLPPLPGVGGSSASPAHGPAATTPTVPTGTSPTGTSPTGTTASGAASISATATSGAQLTPAADGKGRSDRCHTSQLAATDDGSQGAGGSFYGSVTLRNTSTTTCTLYGYPGLQRLTSTKKMLPTLVLRTGKSPSVLSLGPQQQASFGYSYVESPPDTGRCPPAAGQVEVTPPDEADFLLIRSAMAPCDAEGTVRVTAVRAGKGASVATG